MTSLLFPHTYEHMYSHMYENGWQFLTKPALAHSAIREYHPFIRAPCFHSSNTKNIQRAADSFRLSQHYWEPLARSASREYRWFIHAPHVSHQFIHAPRVSLHSGNAKHRERERSWQFPTKPALLGTPCSLSHQKTPHLFIHALATVPIPNIYKNNNLVTSVSVLTSHLPRT